MCRLGHLLCRTLQLALLSCWLTSTATGNLRLPALRGLTALPALLTLLALLALLTLLPLLALLTLLPRELLRKLGDLLAQLLLLTLQTFEFAASLFLIHLFHTAR